MSNNIRIQLVLLAAPMAVALLTSDSFIHDSLTQVLMWGVLALAWNILGTLDLVAAVGLGVISAPGSPLQILGGSVGSAAMWSLPWSNIPTLLVPFYLITHGVIFARLARVGTVSS